MKILKSKEPDLKADIPENLLAIEQAKKTIGDYLLKTDSCFMTESSTETILNKYKEIMNCRERVK